MTFEFIWVDSDPSQLDQVRTLFLTYAEELGVDLCFQGFEQELATLPGKYAAPAGGLLLALVEGHAVGCAAFRPFEGSICELKRFFVLPEYRRHGLASELLSRILAKAADSGYDRAHLDTLQRLEAANSFYRRNGFEEIESYYGNPIPDVVYFSRNI